MADPTPITETRRHQMFPPLDDRDIARLRRFGEVRTFADGTPIMKAGEIAAGLAFVLKGKIDVRQGGAASQRQSIVEHGPGSFLGELAQLSDRPALVDATAIGEVEAIVAVMELLTRPLSVTTTCTGPVVVSAATRTSICLGLM